MSQQQWNPKISGKQKGFASILFFLVIGFIALMILSSTIFITLGPGEKGVLFKRFSGGVDKANVMNQGFHFVAPWNKVYTYDIRVQEVMETMQVLSKNGLNIDVELTCRFNPDPSKVADLHDDIGTGYKHTIIIPEVRSATREIIGRYLPEELYSTKREAIQDEIFNTTSESAIKKNIIIDAILIREVKLPKSLQAAIERKLKEEQESLQYEFRLVKERKEAERKIIEANAKAESNRILSASLNQKILQDKGIEATLELAKSPNSKVIVIGSGDGSLPLILGN